MADNAQKTWFGRDMNRFAEGKVLDAIQLTGKSLPASVVAVFGSIVEVKFEVDAAPFTLPHVIVPLAGPEWIRYPTQIGDKGRVSSSDARLGAMSGLGSGTPKLTLPANLSALVFEPFGNKNWSTTDDAQAVVIYGPNGAILRTVDKNSTVTVNSSGIVANFGGKKITIDATGIVAEFSGKKFTLNGTGLTLDCDLIVNGKIESTGDATLAGTVSFGGGSQAVMLADNSAATKVMAT